MSMKYYLPSFLKIKKWLCTVAHDFTSSTWESEEQEDFLSLRPTWSTGEESRVTQGYIVRPCL